MVISCYSPIAKRFMASVLICAAVLLTSAYPAAAGAADLVVQTSLVRVGDSVGASVSLTNASADSQQLCSAVAVLGIYSGGRLTDTAVRTYSVPGGDAVQDTLTLPLEKGAHAKIFVWDGADLRPLTGMKRIDNPLPFTPRWGQDVIDSAVSAKDINLFFGGISHDWTNALLPSQAMFTLALMAHYNRDLRSTGGKTVTVRLLEQIRNVIKPNRAPSCNGGLSSWVDGPTALALALAKSMPDVWGQLTEEEVDKCDLIMEAMAVTGNYLNNYENSPKSLINQSDPWTKTYNPNLVDGYVAAMISNYVYFGGAARVNANLAAFDYDTFIGQLNANGYNDTAAQFAGAGKTLLETGGTDSRGGKVKGVRIPFTMNRVYGGLTGERVPYEPLALFSAIMRRQCYHTAQSVIYHKNSNEKAGYIADGTVSPFEGQQGMMYEYKTSDADGVRTSSAYVVTGWKHIVNTRVFLEVMGYWQGAETDALEVLMYIGSEDFLYKTARGYRGYSKGRDLGVQSEISHWLNSGNFHGYIFIKDIWLKALREGPNSQRTLPRVGDIALDGVTVSGFDPYRTTYRVSLGTSLPVPVVTASVDERYTVTIRQAESKAGAAVVEVVSKSDPTDFLVYTIMFSTP